MTKEELEKEAKEYGKKATAWLEDREPLDQRDIENAYLAGAEPREKQIKIDAEQIRALQKDKGELTDENKVLKQNLEDSEIVNKSLADRVANLEYQLEGRDNEIKELKAQIEKMKCCYNCKHSRTEYEHCRTDKHEKWEIKENDL